MDSKGYYTILGVPEKAKYNEIRAAYRLLAKKYHPDRNNSDFAEDMIKKINAAFEVLSNREKRRQYDELTFDNDWSHNDNKVDDDDDNNMKYGYYQVQSDQSSSYHHHAANRHENTKMNNNNDLGAELKTQSIDLLDIPKARFHLTVDPSLCMAFGSCETLAPKVFVVEKNKIVNPKAIVKSETGADFDMILAAAQTCPTKAIRIIDRYTGEQIFP
ncbi:MAG TPA: DnaJ domain-containing protein [Nitrososphaeraceae archaeon]